MLISVVVTRESLKEAYQQALDEFFNLYCKFPERKRPPFADILVKYVFQDWRQENNEQENRNDE